MKVWSIRTLVRVKVSRWTTFIGNRSPPSGCWSLYKPPVDKLTGVVHWRIKHGIIASYRYLVHLDPGTEGGCPFCSQTEMIHHLFSQCPRLVRLLSQLQSQFHSLELHFSFWLFLYGPHYSVKEHNVHTNTCHFRAGQTSYRTYCVRGHRTWFWCWLGCWQLGSGLEFYRLTETQKFL